jgi:hypothetical protein
MPAVIEDLGLEIARALARADRIERLAAKRAGSSVRAPRSFRRRGRWLVGGALASALAAAALLLLGLEDDRVPVLNTQEALAAVAVVAEQTPLPRSDQFTYTSSESTVLTYFPGGIDELARPIRAFIVSYPVRKQTWISMTKKGASKAKAGKTTYPSPRDAALGAQYEDAGKRLRLLAKSKTGRNELRAVDQRRRDYYRAHPSGGLLPLPGSPLFDSQSNFGPMSKYLIGSEFLSAAQVAEYPTDPKQIYKRIHDAVSKGNAAFVQRQRAKGHPIPKTIDPNVAVWRFITDPFIAATPPLPPKLRAGLVQALGEIPGVTTSGAQTDRLGRSGTAFALDAGGTHQEVIFDPATSALLSSESVITEPSAIERAPFRRLPKGTMLSSYLMFEQKTVDRAPRLHWPVKN